MDLGGQLSRRHQGLDFNAPRKVEPLWEEVLGWWDPLGFWVKGPVFPDTVPGCGSSGCFLRGSWLSDAASCLGPLADPLASPFERGSPRVC